MKPRKLVLAPKASGPTQKQTEKRARGIQPLFGQAHPTD